MAREWSLGTVRSGTSRFVDRGERPFVLRPDSTKKLSLIWCVRTSSSYKQLPLNFFQIQTKFRDEVRPRFGVMRSREFLMKDALLFPHLSGVVVETYDAMYAVCRIFSQSAAGFPRGTGRYVFYRRQTPRMNSSAGAKRRRRYRFLMFLDYAANIELAEAIAPQTPERSGDAGNDSGRYAKCQNHRGARNNSTCQLKKNGKTLLVKAAKRQQSPLVALLVRGDHELNEVVLKNCRTLPAR
ncbi:hypothetical protein KCP74_25425 [Salmonella enterica subsp. enterica]|nr:hypothetical protein KCP74_25425 [Salmonella enterica subsp. enterica]